MNTNIDSYLDTVFTSFEPELRAEIASVGMLKSMQSGEIIIRTGQVSNTVLIASGRVKLYRESADREEAFIYYLEGGNACALSMICATKKESSQIMEKRLKIRC